jgi:hypothetical protein
LETNADCKVRNLGSPGSIPILFNRGGHNNFCLTILKSVTLTEHCTGHLHSSYRFFSFYIQFWFLLKILK